MRRSDIRFLPDFAGVVVVEFDYPGNNQWEVEGNNLRPGFAAEPFVRHSVPNMDATQVRKVRSSQSNDICQDVTFFDVEE